MCFGKVGRQPKSVPGIALRLACGSHKGFRIVQRSGEQCRLTEAGPGARVPRVDLDRVAKQVDCGRPRPTASGSGERASGKIEIVRLSVGDQRTRKCRGPDQLALKRSGDCRSDASLDGEDVVEGSVITVRPQLDPVLRTNQVRADSHALTLGSDRSLDDIFDP